MDKYNLDIVGFGALNLDQIYYIDEITLDSESIIRKKINQCGGSAANTIYGLSKLGAKTGFIGAVGNDEFGRIMLNNLTSVGVDTSGITIKPNISSGLTLCLVDKKGRRSIYVQPGANARIILSDIKFEYINSARYILLSSFVNTKQFELQKTLINEHKLSNSLIFSPGMIYSKKGLSSLKTILEKVYILFLNKEEIETLTNKPYRKGVKICSDIGCQTIVVTLGAGLKYGNEHFISYVYSKGAEYWIKPIHKKFTDNRKFDTLGAGDAYAAGFIYGILRGKSLEQCGLLGNILSSKIISQEGARKGYPSLKELKEAYKLISNDDI